jgi:hypothetical protein
MIFLHHNTTTLPGAALSLQAGAIDEHGSEYSSLGARADSTREGRRKMSNIDDLPYNSQGVML